jgi:hypothetical protein
MLEQLERTTPQPLVAEAQRSNGFSLGGLIRRGWAVNPVLMVAGMVFLATLAVTLVGLIVDHRTITGQPAWLKPMKFAISLSIYCFTFVWLLGFLRRWKRTAWVLAIVTAFGAAAEMVLLLVQVVRGVASHFNYTTPFDARVFGAMGMIVVFIWLSGLVSGVLLLVARIENAAFAWALRLGMLIALVGMGVAYLMTQPTALQRAAKATGEHLSIIGAHSVGVPDGGPGLPLLGWSTTGGDLRIPHFVGLHALQVLPLLGWLISRARFAGLGMGHRVALVWTMGLGYLGMVGALTWQALRGQALILPDGQTWLVWGGLVGVCLASVAAILLHARLHASAQVISG